MILSLEPMEALRYLPYLAEDGWIITSSAPFKNIPNYPDEQALADELNAQPHVVSLDVERLAKENHVPRSANVILLGAAAAFLKILDVDALRESIGRIFASKGEEVVGRIFASKGEEVVEMNYRAFDIGRDYVKNLNR